MLSVIQQRWKAFLMLSCLVVLQGCASFGIPTADSAKQRIAVGYVGVKQLRDQAYTAALAGKLDKADAANVQKQADVMREGLDIADAMVGTDLSSAEMRLKATEEALLRLQEYIAAKQAKQAKQGVK